MRNKRRMIAVLNYMRNGWESVLDKKIREAIERGEFEDPDWRLAHRMLRNAGFAPAWIEERKDIEAEIEAAKATLARVWTVVQNARHTEHQESAEARWRSAREEFRLKCFEVNRRIDTWNLKAPAVGFHRRRIDLDREIERITN